MNLELKSKNRKASRGRNRRFYTQLDMAIIKKDMATRKAEIKRGEVPIMGNETITECGCGAEGCFIHYGHENWVKKV